jgi:hypothetical protein
MYYYEYIFLSSCTRYIQIFTHNHLFSSLVFSFELEILHQSIYLQVGIEIHYISLLS